MNIPRLIFSFLLIILITSITFTFSIPVLTQHYDIARTGWNQEEFYLTLDNVNVNSFGKLFTINLEGNANVNGQVLFVPNLTINGAIHDAIFVYTSNNANGSPCSVECYDAYSGSRLWFTQLPSAARFTTNTPTINPNTNRMYFVTKDNDDQGSNWLRGFNILTGVELQGSPQLISGSVSGYAPGNINGIVEFTAAAQNCRPGVLLLNDIIYIAFAFNTDQGNYHGWIFGYNYDGVKIKIKIFFIFF